MALRCDYCRGGGVFDGDTCGFCEGKGEAMCDDCSSPAVALDGEGHYVCEACLMEQADDDPICADPEAEEVLDVLNYRRH